MCLRSFPILKSILCLLLTLAGIAGATDSVTPAGSRNSPRPIPADNPMWAHMRETAGGHSTDRPGARLSAEDRKRLNELHQTAIVHYRKGEIKEARDAWRAMLAIDPTEARALTFLENTQSFVGAEAAAAKADEADRARREARQQLLDSPVTIQTERPTPLSEFMRLLSYSTSRELEYSIVEGTGVEIFANFIDRPLREVLDAVLKPVGYAWELSDRGMLVVHSDMKSRTFRLNADQMGKVRALLDAGELQQLVWGRRDPPTPKSELVLDERQRMLLAVGSGMQLQKLTDFLGTLGGARTPEIETRIYKIREQDGPKIRALIDALISADSRVPFQNERRVYVDGSDLVVRDTPENVTKIEELLLDDKFVQSMQHEQLDIANFNLVPRGIENQNTDQTRFFTRRVIEAIQTLLYASTGQEAAGRAGRKMWFDDSTLQLTLVDTPANLQRVGEYIGSLPELRSGKQQKVTFLKYGVAEDLATQVSAMLQLQQPTAAGETPGGDQVVKRLRRGDSFTFHDLRIRLIRVEGGDPNDRFDDTVQLSVISGTTTSNLTLTELETQFFENYEITAEKVQPSGSAGGTRGGGTGQSARTGDGSATLVIRYIPPIQPVQ